MTEDATEPKTFYGELTAKNVQNVLPHNQRGIDAALIEEFLADAEAEVLKATGESKDGDDTLLRGVIRDFATSRSMVKLYGSQDDAGRRAAQGLKEDAETRLDRWMEGEIDEATKADASHRVHNFLPERHRIWDHHGTCERLREYGFDPDYDEATGYGRRG